MTNEQYDAVIAELSLKLAKAIATAEGFFQPGTLPNRIHNPGDMKLGDRGYGVEHEKTIYAKADFNASLDDRTDGASALRRQCDAMLMGGSHVYSPNDTFESLSIKWTGGDNPGAWCKIVTDNLNVSPLTVLADWIKLAVIAATVGEEEQ
jgi:hypothetical protein